MVFLPQELEIWYVLPALRREFALALTQKHKLSQRKAAEILGRLRLRLRFPQPKPQP